TGHGVPGAILAMAGSVFLKQIVGIQKITNPNEILRQLHINIIDILKQKTNMGRDGMDVSICTIDPLERKLSFAGARNTLMYVQQGMVEEVLGDSVPVGGFLTKKEAERKFQTHSLLLLPESPTSFYIFTDGYLDQFGGSRGRKYMRSRFRKLLANIHEEPMAVQKELISKNMSEWMEGQKQIDDMLVVGFKI
ncbi:MAG: SpoIIE family protein phosphatase, partial [Bacteroidota bacterium]